MMKDKIKKYAVRWLIFFYSVPSNPVSSRVKIWRRLTKAGSIQLKKAVYILPYSEEHYEFLQWLLSEILSINGEGAFIKVNRLETMEDGEIIELFNKQREDDYVGIERQIEDLERKINSVKKWNKNHNSSKFSSEFNKLAREFDDIKRIDFFSSKAGQKIECKIKSLKLAIKTIVVCKDKNTLSEDIILTKKIEDFQNKKWVTRKKPFIDRMASAWLIRRFIDNKAKFIFMEEKEIDSLTKEDSITFDVKNGDFTHNSNLCTFETLMKAFGIKDKAVKKIAEIVHELDVKDEKFKADESKGIERLLIGIRKTAKSDIKGLKKGMEIFEMLYASKI